ncbi:hypothetical protein SO802_035295 [Lithocarpus litseifolius]|uniref:Uncharacterized protein n=1 Tax=Lithocarpus litseifolius TaxID=425828 RepID=A0AAW2B9G2_9ROSI
MRWIEKCSCLRSFDLSSATDRFPLLFQRAVIESLFNRVVAHAWTFSGLEVNVFRAPQGTLREDIKFIKFSTGQPLGFLSSLILSSLELSLKWLPVGAFERALVGISQMGAYSSFSS